MTRPERIAPYVITFLLGTTLAGGVSAVAASASKPAKACETAKYYVVGAVHGKCPAGSTAHAIGATGPRGKPGKAGKPGTNGLSVALVGTATGSDSTAFTDTYTPVLTINNAPAGHYVVSFDYAPSTAKDETAGTALTECEVVTASNEDLIASSMVTTPHSVVLTGVDPVTLTAAGSIDVSCHADGAINVYPSDFDAHLVALRVTTLAP